LISKILSSEPHVENNSLYFYGTSIGAGLAIETAKKLIKDKIVTQSREEKSKPHLVIRLNIPPGQSDIPKSQKKWQIPVGFVMEKLGFLI
jgi:hypothetical protein